MLLKILYFLPWVFFLFYYLVRLFNASDFARYQQEDEELNRRKKEEYQRLKEIPEGVRAKATIKYTAGWSARTATMISLVTWEFIGLLSSSWFIFLSWIIVGLVLGFVLKPFKGSAFRMVVVSLVGIVFILAAIINSFHLHYTGSEVWQLLQARF
jgi:hypothetical protein